MASTSNSSTPVLSHIGLVHGDMASLLWQTSLLSRQCNAPLHIDGYVHRYARYIGVVRLGGCFVTNSPPHLMSPNATTEHHNSMKLYQIDLTDISCGNFSSDDDELVSPVFGKEKKSPNHEKQDESGK